MKKKTSKAIKGLLLVSGVATAGVCTLAIKNNTFNTGKKEEANLVENDIMDVENANVLEEAQKEVNVAKAQVEKADIALEAATKAQEEAEKEVQNADEAIETAQKAKSEAQAQVKAAKTEEERKAAEEKVKAVETQIQQAQKTKKEAEAKVQTAKENTKKAEDVKTEALNNVQKAEDNKKTIEEQVKKEAETTVKEEKIEETKKTEVKTQENTEKEEVKKTETKQVEAQKQTETKTSTKNETKNTEEQSTKNRTLPQSALDAAARSEQAAKEAEAAAKAEADRQKAEAAAKAEADRLAQEAEEERQRQEREAWEKEIQRQSEEVNSRPSESKDPLPGDRTFTFKSAPSNAEEERYIQSLDRVKSNISGIKFKTASITVDKTENLKKGQIWWVEMSCNLTMCEGFPGHFNTAKVSVRLEGLRDSEDNIVLEAPKAKAGYRFVGWKTYTVRYNDEIDIRGFEAVYEKM